MPFACGAAAVLHVERRQQAAEVLHPRGQGQGGDHPPPCPTKEMTNPVSSPCMCHLFGSAGGDHPPPARLQPLQGPKFVHRPDKVGRHLRRHDPAHTGPAHLVSERQTLPLLALLVQFRHRLTFLLVVLQLHRGAHVCPQGLAEQDVIVCAVVKMHADYFEAFLSHSLSTEQRPLWRDGCGGSSGGGVGGAGGGVIEWL